MTIDKLEKRVRKRMFDFHEEFIFDWAQYSFQTVIHLFHSNFFPITNQTEEDIIRRIWSLIDYAFDNMKMDVRRSVNRFIAFSISNKLVM